VPKNFEELTMARFLWAIFPWAIVAVTGASADAAFAANLCVSQISLPGCFGTIGAAVAAATPGATIVVMQGVYTEDVHITQPLSLVAAEHAQPLINAIGQSNGIFIDGGVGIGSGAVTPGANTLSQVTVAGFTIENAKFEGILVANASFVTLRQNTVTNNDLFLQLPTAENGNTETCPFLPAFETNEGDDCGEGIHLIAVDHATVIGNHSYGNSGGMLLTDETGPTHDNLIEGNTVENNLYDCGITLASHPVASSPYIIGSPAPFGVYSNTIAGNISHHNGTGLPGAGAGVGLFAPGPLNQTYANVVSGNRLTDNGLPGVAIHNHAPTNNINLSNNVIIGNYIAGNGPDGGVEVASDQQVPTGISVLGVSPITGLVITQNWIEGESTDIVITNAGASVDVLLNALTGNGNGISNLSNPVTNSSPGLVFAAENWWGCQSGPGTSGCSSVSGPNVVSTPFLPQSPQAQTQ
jgi:hypothetical protein